MDLSKLPKLSNTQKTLNPPAGESTNTPAAAGQTGGAFCHQCGSALRSGARFCDSCGAQTAAASPAANAAYGIEAWLGLIVGIFLLFMNPRFLQWVSSRLFHTHFNEFTLDDVVVAYQNVPAFWEDLGPTLFGLLLVIEGLVLGLLRKRPLVILCFVLTILVAGYNLIYVVTTFQSRGFAPISFLAAAFGIMIAIYQWNLLQSMARRPASA
ncbi:MAG TPA: zinc ribbon domain-containing protein [Tepidisphaeraceae bacterium]|jgi:hypothetical protein